jgi:hypothetical protein
MAKGVLDRNCSPGKFGMSHQQTENTWIATATRRTDKETKRDSTCQTISVHISPHLLHKIAGSTEACHPKTHTSTP